MKENNRGVDWQQKDQRFCPAILDCRLSKNLQDLRPCNKIHDWSHEKLKIGIDSKGKTRAEVKVNWCIFQGDAHSTLLFVIVMMPLNHKENALGATTL